MTTVLEQARLTAWWVAPPSVRTSLADMPRNWQEDLVETGNTGDAGDADATSAETAAERPLSASPSRVPSSPAAPPLLFARLVRGSGLLLLLGAAVLFVAFYLPWEHIVEFNSGVPGNRVTVDLPVYSLLMPNPGLLYAELPFGSTIAHTAVARITWDVFWHAALPTLGLLLALAGLALYWRGALRYTSRDLAPG